MEEEKIKKSEMFEIMQISLKKKKKKKKKKK